jgi:hypothetical protein
MVRGGGEEKLFADFKDAGVVVVGPQNGIAVGAVSLIAPRGLCGGLGSKQCVQG